MKWRVGLPSNNGLGQFGHKWHIRPSSSSGLGQCDHKQWIWLGDALAMRALINHKSDVWQDEDPMSIAIVIVKVKNELIDEAMVESIWST